GVDQKQVQRWLKRAKDQPLPRRVKGLDGRNYPASRMSAPHGMATTADTPPFIDFQQLSCRLDDLLAVVRSVRKAFHEYRAVKNEGAGDDEAQRRASTAGFQVLVKAGLWNPNYYPNMEIAEERLRTLIQSLAELLTNNGLQGILHTVRNLLDERR